MRERRARRRGTRHKPNDAEAARRVAGLDSLVYSLSQAAASGELFSGPRLAGTPKWLPAGSASAAAPRTRDVICKHRTCSQEVQYPPLLHRLSPPRLASGILHLLRALNGMRLVGNSPEPGTRPLNYTLRPDPRPSLPLITMALIIPHPTPYKPSAALRPLEVHA